MRLFRGHLRLILSFFAFAVDLLTPIPTSIWNGFKHLMSRKDSMNRRAFKNELLKFSDGLRKEQITKPTLHKWSARGKIHDILVF